MAEGLVRRGHEVTVATTDDAGPGRRMDPADQAALRTRFAARGAALVVARKDTEFYKVSLGLARWLNRHVGEFDLVHIHALFSFASIAAARAAARSGVPYVVRPLGVLDRYGMTRRRPILKRLSLALLDGPALNRAAAVHFTSEAEREAAGSLVDPARAAVIPLGVSAPTQADPSDLLRTVGTPPDRPRLLFLSRLDPKKNLDGLLRALALLREGGPQPFLLIAGAGEPGYVDALHRLARSLDLERSVAWLGPVADGRKAAAWAAADIFILPSHSENFGIAAAEAMLAGKACILGNGVALALEAVKARAAYLTGANPTDIAEAIRIVLADPAGARKTGRRARAYGATRFASAVAAQGLEALYASRVGAAPAAAELSEGVAH
jgi:glycosyltransferase involved in cell wall biosynthesis